MSEAPLRLAVMASGRGSNLQAIIDAIESKTIRAELVLVISDKKDSMALDRGVKHGIKSIFIDPNKYSIRGDYDVRIVEILKESQAGLLVLAGYMRIITSYLIDAYKNKIINIHPSLLPSFPGLKVQHAALSSGVKVSGCTVHIVGSVVDQGPIVIQATVPVLGGDTEETLSARILKQEHLILPQAIRYFAEDRIQVTGRQVIIKDVKNDPGSYLVSPPIESR